MRYTKKFIEARFESAMKAIGLPTGETYIKGISGQYIPNVGVYFIDHAPGYGGYRIAKMHENGAESTPFGMDRKTASEFVALLTGILYAADVKEK